MTENIYTIKTQQFKANMEGKRVAFRTHMNNKKVEVLRYIDEVRR